MNNNSKGTIVPFPEKKRKKEVPACYRMMDDSDPMYQPGAYPGIDNRFPQAEVVAHILPQ